MKKMLILLLACLAICLALVSCGEDDEKTGVTTGVTTGAGGNVDWSSTNKTSIEIDFGDIFGGSGYELPEDEF